MAINFPTSPTLNDVHTDGENSWTWNGTSWVSSAVIVPPLPSQTGQAGEYLQTDGTAMSWEAVDALPSQTGQAGEFLQTDGTNATWEAVDALPSQTGQAGEYLTTDGTNASWEAVTSPTATAVSDQANTSTGYFDLPAGTIAQRPGSPATGNMRWNTDDEALEHYAGSAAGWVQFAGASPIITNITPTTSIAAGTTITVTGVNFQAGTTVKLIGTDTTQYNAQSVTFVSTTEIQFTTPELPVSGEPFDVKLTLPAGGFAISTDVIDAGGVPAWTTAAGLLGTVAEDTTGTHFTLVATDPDGQAVTFSMDTANTTILTNAGFALNGTTGAITGDPTDVSSPTTYNFDVTATDSTGVNATTRSFSITVSDPWTGASGGTETTYQSGGINYKVHTFTSSGTFDAGPGGTAAVLMIGGGGAGAHFHCGGGGGGGLIEIPDFVMSGGTYVVVIGAGGTGQSGTTDQTVNSGGDTTFISEIAIGGGGSGTYGGANSKGQDGGSGGGDTGGGPGTFGGGGGIQADPTTHTGTGYGFNGGFSTTPWTHAGGGGGGAGQNGHNATGSGASGGGGNGRENNYQTGSNITYAGGGGGGCWSGSNPAGGSGGGGNGGSGNSTNNQNGTNGLGGGGGGFAGNSGAASPNNGGSGIVIIRTKLT
jgi:hypothetical protein